MVQGVPGVTLPGVAGERGLAGEKVSVQHLAPNLQTSELSY